MPITAEQLRAYRGEHIMVHTMQTIPSRLHSVDGFTVDLRDVVTANAAASATSAVASRCDDSSIDEHFSQSPTFPRIRNNSACSMDVDSIRNTLEGMTQNAVFGDLAVLRDRQFRSIRYNADLLHTLSRDALLRKLKEDDRRSELEQIKILRSIKATIRYIVEIK